MNPKVSILIISYNELGFLSQAVESCLSQKYDNIEIIIGDDGSTDGSIEYIQSLGDKVRHFIMTRDNEPVIPSIRVSNVIRRGLDLSDGDYFTILSGDDYYIYPEFISTAVSFLENYPDYFAYVYGFQQVDESGKKLMEFLPNILSNNLYWSGEYIHISSFVFRKLHSDELLNRMSDDTGLVYVLANKGKWKYDKKSSLAYRQREKSIQHKADMNELCILEMMIFQDILNSSNNNIKRNATLAHFYKPVSYLSKHRNELTDSKYSKYFSSCSKYGNNILKSIADGDFGIFKLFGMLVFYLFYKVIRKANKIANMNK